MKGFPDESKSQGTNSRSTQLGGRVGTRVRPSRLWALFREGMNKMTTNNQDGSTKRAFMKTAVIKDQNDKIKTGTLQFLKNVTARYDLIR